MNNKGQLNMFTIYENPSDYPGKFVVRRFVLEKESTKVAAKPTLVCDTLEEAREGVPFGFFRMVRSPHDEPQIVETWI